MPSLGIADAFLKAVRQLPEPGMRRPLVMSLLWTLLSFGVLWTLIGVGLHIVLQGHFWAGWTVSLLGIFAVPLLTILLFPMVATMVLGLYSETIIIAVERRFYPALPPVPATRWRDQVRSLVWLTAIGSALNLLTLPIYLLIPGANLVLFLILNGYLLGRSYYELVALRRLDWRSARQLWHRHRLGFTLIGAAMAGLFSVPFVNLLAPVIGAAATVHVFEQARMRSTIRAGKIS